MYITVINTVHIEKTDYFQVCGGLDLVNHFKIIIIKEIIDLRLFLANFNTIMKQVPLKVIKDSKVCNSQHT